MSSLKEIPVFGVTWAFCPDKEMSVWVSMGALSRQSIYMLGVTWALCPDTVSVSK